MKRTPTPKPKSIRVTPPGQINIKGRLYKTRYTNITKVAKWIKEGYIEYSRIEGTDIVTMVKSIPKSDKPKSVEKKAKQVSKKKKGAK